MASQLRRFLVCLFLLMGGWSPPAASAQSIRAVVDSLGAAVTEGHPGGAVIGLLATDPVSINGQPMTEPAVFGFGAVDSAGTAPTAQTLFEIGSVTKTFTALLLADAIERGLVRPDDPIQPYLPDSLEAPTHERGPITLEQLVTHRSGLPRMPSNFMPSALANPQDPYAGYSVRDLHAFLDGFALPRIPGERYAYSNLGAGLLGHLLARQADTSFAALVQQRIAAPLGLSDTRIDLTPDQQARFAQGHNAAGAPTAPWHIPALGGAGALRSTAADMLAYLRAHLAAPDTTALDRALRRVVQPIARADLGTAEGFADTQIGYGWHFTPRGEATIIWHNGGTGGFSSFVGFNREAGVGVVVLASASVSSAVTSGGFTLMEALLRAARAPAADQP